MWRTFGKVVGLLSSARQRIISIGVAAAQPLGAFAYTTLVLSLVVCTSSSASLDLLGIVQDRLQVAMLPPFEAQQLAAGLFTPSYPLRSIVRQLLPWQLAFGSDYVALLEASASGYLIWTAADACSAVIFKLFSPRPRVVPSMLMIWSGRRRLHFASCILAALISASCLAFPVVSIFGEALNLSDKAIVLYERGCSFGNADDLRCQLLHRATMHLVDASLSSRLTDLYYAVRQAVGRRTAQGLLITLSSANPFFFEVCVDILIEIWSVIRRRSSALVNVHVVLDMTPHAPDCEFCAGTASPRR